MKKILRTISYSLAAYYFLVATRAATAAAPAATGSTGVDVGVAVNGQSHFAGFNSYISAILKYSIRLGFALATLMLIYAGIKYLISQGNQTQINDAKEIMMGAIIGFSILLLIDMILRFLGII